MLHSSQRLSYFLLAVATAFLLEAPVRATLPTGVLTPTKRTSTLISYELNITLGRGGPDCSTRDVILVSGLFQPTILVNVNDTLQITVRNQLPSSFPATSAGISLHFHGLSMWDKAAWWDGTLYVSQCPIAPGSSFTYKFLVDESPGTYVWHDHSTVNRANGLTGPFIVGFPTKKVIKSVYNPDGEHTMFLTDWYHAEANYMAMQLNRPYDRSKATNDSGTYSGAGTPDSVLINGKGAYMDCDLASIVPYKEPYEAAFCDVTQLTYPPSQPGTQDGHNGCTHEVFEVEAGKTYLFRLINAGSSLALTVCFEGHSVDVIMADGTPTDRFTPPNGCVDVNSGQRYDVLLDTTQEPGSKWWISVFSQYHSGAPSAFGVLKYTATGGDDPAASDLPPNPTPINSVDPWDLQTQSYIISHDGVLGYLDNYEYISYWALFQHRGLYSADTLYYARPPNKTIVLNMTMPMMRQNGMLRWAINNIATPENPPCSPVMSLMAKDPNWIKNHAVTTAASSKASTAALLNATYTTNSAARVYVDGQTPPVFPAVGMQLVEVAYNDIVDIVINNLPDGAMNGDYGGVKRSSSEQHPMHLHGHKYWVLGKGLGVYDPKIHWATLNFLNPVLRDTITLPEGGWAVIRFLANNPGLWPLHCHNLWHVFMGQQMYIVEAKDRIPAPPTSQPKCPTQCISNFAPFTKSWVKKMYNITDDM